MITRRLAGQSQTRLATGACIAAPSATVAGPALPALRTLAEAETKKINVAYRQALLYVVAEVEAAE